MRACLSLIFALPAAAQIVASYAQQGPEALRALTGARIPSVAVLEIRACNIGPAEVTISAGRIVQIGHARGVVIFDPIVAEAVLDRTAKHSKAQRTAEASEGLSLVGAGLVAGNIIKAGSGWTTAAIGAASAAHWLSGKLKAKQPDMSRIRAAALPVQLQLSAGECAAGLALGRYDPQMSKPVISVID